MPTESTEPPVEPSSKTNASGAEQVLGDASVENTVDRAQKAAALAKVSLSNWGRFFSSGLFFMIVGGLFIWAAYSTIGKTHAAMTFVFVVVGVAILQYGTGTQGIGNFDSGENAGKVARYKVALAGGAGVLAFCIAAGFVTFDASMKRAFRVEQDYVRLDFGGNSIEPSDISLYVPIITVNGEPAAASIHGSYIEVFVPYLMNGQMQHLAVDVQLYLPPDVNSQKAASLLTKAKHQYSLLVDQAGQVTTGQITGGKVVPENGGSYIKDAGYDFPKFVLTEAVDLTSNQIPGTNLEAH